MYDVLIIGTGCAGYATADWLHKTGVTNICVVSENRHAGTSRNAGSDKQTYYKISLDGMTDDSAYKMAQDLAAGGSMDGHLAYTESVNSAKCFAHLCDIGVNFPQDEFGGYVGYKTDHDNTKRATSVGPYTSKIMTERLEERVLDCNKTTLVDQFLVVKILVKDKRAVGVVGIDKTTKQVKAITAKYVVLATGAPASIYHQSVYPFSQHGMTGVALTAGAELVNFTEWQYGMASTKFRWNVSGSFMQVLPRLVSVDTNGQEREFLIDHFKSASDAYNMLFRKGYQWPFDTAKMEQSSLIDILVQGETAKGNKVYLDYTRDPMGLDFDTLSDECRTYLGNSDALVASPIERLRRLNKKAIDLYNDHNIDLCTELLEIKVCAQHNNGGLLVDCNYETSVQGLFAVGEVAGVFGVTRQGGTALNSTQVGGLRVAEFVSKQLQANIENGANIAIEKSLSGADFEAFLDEQINIIKDETRAVMIGSRAELVSLCKDMSANAGFLRDKQQILSMLEKVDNLLQNGFLTSSTTQYFLDKDMLISQKSLLEAILLINSKTGSRGSAVFRDNGKIAHENAEYRQMRAITKNGQVQFEKVRPVPRYDKWFETYLGKI